MKTTRLVKGVERELSMEAGSGFVISPDDIDELADVAIGLMLNDNVVPDVEDSAVLQVPLEYIARAKGELERRRKLALKYSENAMRERDQLSGLMAGISAFSILGLLGLVLFFVDNCR